MHRREFGKLAARVASAGMLGSRALASPAVAHDYSELTKHRVAEITTRRVPYRWPRLVGKNAKRGVHGQDRTDLVAVLKTDQGATGWGLAHPGAGGQAERVQGKTVSELIDPTWGIADGVPQSFDFALHDLAGVILGQPVYKLLGAAGPRKVPCYSGMIYFDELEPEDNPAGFDRVLANCEWDLDYGYRQLKVKIGRGNRWYARDKGLRADIDIVNRIGDRFADRGVELLVDANDGYSERDARAFLQGVAGAPLVWIEEPFREHRVKTARLHRWMQDNGFAETLLADGEAQPDRKLCLGLAERGVLGACLHDVHGFGFTPWRRLMPKLAELGCKASPHAWGTRLKTHYVAHLAAGLGNCVTVEGVTCESDAIDYGEYPLVEGRLRVSDKPGFGMKLVG
ncbi:MAG: enolase C-terminal domain-like protein [Planctomycetota bacterium]